MTVETGLCLTWSEPQIVGFLMHRLILHHFNAYPQSDISCIVFPISSNYSKIVYQKHKKIGTSFYNNQGQSYFVCVCQFYINPLKGLGRISSGHFTFLFIHFSTRMIKTNEIGIFHILISAINLSITLNI